MFSDEMLKLLRVLLTVLKAMREQLKKENVTYEKMSKTWDTISPLLSWVTKRIAAEEKERKYLSNKTTEALKQARKK